MPPESVCEKSFPSRAAPVGKRTSIARIVNARGLKQVEVAKVLGADQAKVSALARGVLAGFSTERLFRFLNALDQDIEIVIREKRRSSGRAGLG